MSILDEARAYRAAQDAMMRKVSAEISPEVAVMCTGAWPAWSQRAWALNERCNYQGQSYRCVQAHDATDQPDWHPGAAASLWAVDHAKAAEYAKPYIQPLGAHDAYMAGEWCLWEDKPYKCVTDNTVHDPGTLPGSWEVGA